ncbi:glycerol kinase GlpK [Castellaniella caeni]|uniref:glycerol kinase GlpK n=1 Tax=Castellaniella caeni TaxID=266123 RepID=UPI00082A52A9|nr:glycerol kinase GlpK [Castellaniella caeni]
MTYLLALDQGTSSTRSIVFDRFGRIVGLAQREFTQHYPQPGWVEHDPMEIWHTQRDTLHEALNRAGIGAQDISAIGITNQRETTVVWDRRSGEPIYPAIVWQDRRAEPSCAQLRERGLEATILQRTGLRIDAYFSATKLQWILDHVPGARARAQAGELLFGTIDSWLIWQLTGGQRHLTDVSNAARTMLMDVHRNAWDAELLDQLDIPARMMPTILPSSADFGATSPELLGRAVPICGVAGDQQSALFGQACFRPGMVKNTYGTGCFMLMHTGNQFQTSTNGLVTTSAAQTDQQPAYALEGSVFVGGAVVQWLRDGLRAFVRSSDIEALAGSVPDSGGVMFVPAFTGLGAPWWDPDARGTITGLTRGSTMAHIARAALESIAYQSAALLQAMSRDAQAAGAHELRTLRVDGGACVNDLLMQFQADLLGIPVQRPTMVETTALGAAFLAGLQAGVYADLQELESLWRIERQFDPAMPRDQAAEALARWDQAVRQACTR